MQRLRVRFSRGEEIKYITHLDIVRLWERALIRAQVPLAYSEGFTSHPRIALAAPLPLGVTSKAEMMDVFLVRRIPFQSFLKSMSPQLPPGIDVLEVREVFLELPSLQSQLRAAEYQIESKTKIEAAIDLLLRQEHISWQHMRDTGPRYYDLRPLIEDIWILEGDGNSYKLGMLLRHDSRGAGRPEQVVAALGFSEYPCSIHRTKLILTSRKGGETPSKVRRITPHLTKPVLRTLR